MCESHYIYEDFSVVSPCDARVISCGPVTSDRLDQIKGLSYSLSTFLGVEDNCSLGDSEPASMVSSKGLLRVSSYLFFCFFATSHPSSDADISNVLLGRHADSKDLYHIVLYLAPGDYHRIHSPGMLTLVVHLRDPLILISDAPLCPIIAEWTIERRTHFPGCLLPVNPPFVGLVPNVFSVNERVALTGRWGEDHAFFSLTAVGAYNVGSIALSFDKVFPSFGVPLEPIGIPLVLTLFFPHIKGSGD